MAFEGVVEEGSEAHGGGGQPSRAVQCSAPDGYWWRRGGLGDLSAAGAGQSADSRGQLKSQSPKPNGHHHHPPESRVESTRGQELGEHKAKPAAR